MLWLEEPRATSRPGAVMVWGHLGMSQGWWKMSIWGKGENQDEGVTVTVGNVQGELGWARSVPLSEEGEVPKRNHGC